MISIGNHPPLDLIFEAITEVHGFMNVSLSFIDMEKSREICLCFQRCKRKLDKKETDRLKVREKGTEREIDMVKKRQKDK